MKIRMYLGVGNKRIAGTFSDEPAVFTADDGTVYQLGDRYILFPMRLADYTYKERTWVKSYILMHGQDSPHWRFSESWFTPTFK